MTAAADRPRPFRASWWAAGPHAQTLIGRFMRSSVGPEFRRERRETPDGDFLDVDLGPDPGPGAPIALVLHGLEGSSRRPYVRSVCRELLAGGVQPVAMNFRGCSGTPNRRLRTYHSGFTEDPAWLLSRIRAEHPGRALGAVGFSLGGNVLLKMLGERSDGGVGLLDAAAVISVPYDLAAGSALLQRSIMGRLYTEYFLRSLRRKILARRDEMATLVDVEAGLAARSIWAFDDAITAPLNGFDDAAAYYERCSSARFLAAVRTPTLMLHADDDPFLPKNAIPVDPADANPALHLVRAARGGHVGFLEGHPWQPRFWADQAAATFVADRLRRVG